MFVSATHLLTESGGPSAEVALRERCSYGYCCVLLFLDWCKINRGLIEPAVACVLF